MTVQKLSQIALSPSNLAATDYLVGVTSGNVDYRFTGAQAGAATSIVVNTTPIIGGTDKQLFYDNAGTINEIAGSFWKSGTLELGLPSGSSFEGTYSIMKGASGSFAGIFGGLATDGSNWRVAVSLDGTDSGNIALGPGGGTYLDTFLYRDAPNTFAQRGFGLAQTFRVYNTSADNTANYERASFDWITTSNVFRIRMENAGSGTNRIIALDGFAKAGAAANTDLPAGTWGLIHDTSGATIKLVYNDAGTLRTVALT